jgi:hypothetical protein
LRNEEQRCVLRVPVRVDGTWLGVFWAGVAVPAIRQVVKIAGGTAVLAMERVNGGSTEICFTA